MVAYQKKTKEESPVLPSASNEDEDLVVDDDSDGNSDKSDRGHYSISQLH